VWLDWHDSLDVITHAECAANKDYAVTSELYDIGNGGFG
jgi:hypothetical protein